MTTDLRGLWVPVVTPFDEDGDVDTTSLTRLARRLLSDGATGLVALGTTGEPATLTPAERRLVVDVCDEACRLAGRRLIVGAGTNSTRGTIDEVAALTAGTAASAVLIVVPYYTRPAEAAVVEHVTTVADASAVPVVAYHVPYRTGRPLGADALLSIAEHPNVAGLKQAVGSLDADTLELLARRPHDVDVLAGDDAFIAPTMLLGGSGAIAAAAHLCTPLFVALVDAALAGDHGRAAALAARSLPVVTAGFAEPNPAVWKGALAQLGEITTGELRRPMTPATDASIERVVAAAASATARLGPAATVGALAAAGVG